MSAPSSRGQKRTTEENIQHFLQSVKVEPHLLRHVAGRYPKPQHLHYVLALSHMMRDLFPHFTLQLTERTRRMALMSATTVLSTLMPLFGPLKTNWSPAGKIAVRHSPIDYYK